MDELELLDWKRRVFELYAEVRAAADPSAAWEPLARHARRALPRAPAVAAPPNAARASSGLAYFDYDPALRVLGTVEPAERVQREIATSRRAARTRSRASRASASSSMARHVAGPVLARRLRRRRLPLRSRDATSGDETYGAGPLPARHRQGRRPRRARTASSSSTSTSPTTRPARYDPRWVCPLAPPGTGSPIPIRGGERYPLEEA